MSEISGLLAALAVFGLMLIALTDRPEPKVSMVLPQGTCDPAKTQVIHTDNARQMTVMLDRGVDCVTILEGVK